MHLETRMLCQPCLDLLGLVGPVVVANHMHIEMPGHYCIDLFEEAQKLLGPVTRHASPMTSPACICVTLFALAATSAANRVVTPLRL